MSNISFSTTNFNYRRSNFVYHHWGCTSNYRPLSHFFRFLVLLITLMSDKQLDGRMNGFMAATLLSNTHVNIHTPSITNKNCYSKSFSSIPNPYFNIIVSYHFRSLSYLKVFLFCKKLKGNKFGASPQA